MKDILVSIIVPIYNVEAYLNRCIDSILQQTYRNIEIVLVDDGSTDDSSHICDYYQQMDNRIVVIHKENEGLVSARKAGLCAANGEYILNIDGDDWIEPDMCEALLKRAAETDADIVDSGYYENRNGMSKQYGCVDGLYDLEKGNTKIDLLEEWLKNPMNKRMHSTIWSKLYKKLIFKKVYSEIGMKQSYGEDILTFLETLKEMKTLAVVDKCFYHYEVRNDSLSNKTEFDRFYKYNELDICIYKKILEFFPQVNKDILNDWYVERKRHIVDVYNCSNSILRNVYIIPKKELLTGNIILYGAGKVGSDYYRQLSIYTDVNIVSWVDKHPERYDYDYYKVTNLRECLGKTYDYVLIAVADQKLSDSIKTDLIAEGFDADKIVWIEPQKMRMCLY